MKQFSISEIGHFHFAVTYIIVACVKRVLSRYSVERTALVRNPYFKIKSLYSAITLYAPRPLMRLCPVLPPSDIHLQRHGEGEGVFHFAFDELFDCLELALRCFNEKLIVNLQDHP